MIVRTQDPDGNDIEYDPIVLIKNIVNGNLADDPDAELVAAALALGWVHTLLKDKPPAPEKDILMKMDAASFVAFVKSDPAMTYRIIDMMQGGSPLVHDGQRRRWGWRR